MKRALVLLPAVVIAGIAVAALARSSDGARAPNEVVAEACPSKPLPLP